MIIPRCNERTILCKCGHPLSHHAMGPGECYASTRRTEKKKNHLGKEVKVKCCYTCYCKKFELDKTYNINKRRTNEEV